MLAGKFGREHWQPVELPIRPAIFDRYILALDITDLAETLAERRQDIRLRREETKIANHRHCLLRARRRRPRCCASKKYDEFASPHDCAPPPNNSAQRSKPFVIPRAMPAPGARALTRRVAADQSGLQWKASMRRSPSVSSNRSGRRHVGHSRMQKNSRRDKRDDRRRASTRNSGRPARRSGKRKKIHRDKRKHIQLYNIRREGCSQPG